MNLIKSQRVLLRFGVHILNKRRAVLLLLVAVSALGLVSSMLQPVFSPKPSRGSPGRGAFKMIGVGIYRNPDLTDALSSISWGMLEPGVSQNYTCYVRNEGSSSVVLSLSTINWNPIKASTFISLGWDYGGESLVPSEVVEVTFVLSVSPDVSGVSSFSFDTVVSSSNA